MSAPVRNRWIARAMAHTGRRMITPSRFNPWVDESPCLPCFIWAARAEFDPRRHPRRPRELRSDPREEPGSSQSFGRYEHRGQTLGEPGRSSPPHRTGPHNARASKSGQTEGMPRPRPASYRQGDPSHTRRGIRAGPQCRCRGSWRLQTLVFITDADPEKTLRLKSEESTNR